MLDLASVRRAIDDVEKAFSAVQPNPQAHPFPAGSTLARLYSVYAQAMLEAHGIQVDLEELCTQCCRECPDGRCARNKPVM